MLHVAVAGALGRMGREVVKAITNEQGVVMGPKLGPAAERPNRHECGKTGGGQQLVGGLWRERRRSSTC